MHLGPRIPGIVMPAGIVTTGGVLQSFEDLIGYTVTNLWVGDSLSDLGPGGNDLTIVGSASAGNATTGLVSGNGITELAFDLPTDGSADALSAGTGVGQLDGTDTMFIALVKGPAANPGATRSIFGHRTGGAGNAGLEVTVQSTGAVLSVMDGSGATFETLPGGDYWDDAWHVIAIAADENAGNFYIASETNNGGTASIPAGDKTNNEPFTIGDGRLQSAKFKAALIAIVRGAQVQGIDGTSLQSLCSTIHTELVA